MGLNFAERERLRTLTEERALTMDLITGMGDEIATLIQTAEIRDRPTCPVCQRTADVIERQDGTMDCPMKHPQG